MERIRTGVVGYGLGGRVFHAPFVSAVPALELSAIVQRTGDSAATAYSSVALLRSFDDLLASDVELVCISTPSNTHYRLSRQALLAGKHVVCDKPVTVTSAEAEDLETTAKAQGVLMVPFQNRRWDGDFLTLKALISGDTVGRTVTLDSRFDRYRPLAKAGAWRDDAEGGGLLYDIGPHLIDQALALFGRPERVWADVRRDRDEQGNTADAFDLHLWFTGADGRELTVRTGSTVLAVNPGPRYRLQGTRGSYVKFGLDPQEPAIIEGAKVPHLDSPEPWLDEPAAAWGTLSLAADPADPAKVEQTQLPTVRGDYRAFYRNVADAIRGKAEQAVPARAAVHVARIIEVALESARTGGVMPVNAASW